MLPAGIGALAVLGALAGVLAAVLSGAPNSGLAAGGRLALPDSAVPAVAAAQTRRSAVTPLGQTVQADLLVVAPFSLPSGLLDAVSRQPGMVAAEQIEAVRMKVNGSDTAVVGVDPSQFRSF